jgi:hypothetical protein
MKKKGILAVIVIMALAIMAFRNSGEGVHYTFKYAGGGPVGYSGDPASGNNTCAYCHSGSPVTTESDWITSDIPESGYAPNTTYTITAAATGSGIEKFGFQISPQNSEGTFLGTLASTNDETSLTSDPGYITHTAAGTGGNGSRTWTFDWTAPESGSGDVTFYGAFNLTNNDGRYTGDNVVLSTLMVSELDATGMDGLDSELSVMLYPNPAIDFITIALDHSMLGSSYFVTDMAGRMVSSGSINSESTRLPVNHLKAGLYHLQIGLQSKTAFQVIK